MRVLVLTAICLMSAISRVAAADPLDGNWAFYGGDAGGSRYSPLDQINKTNVTGLKPAWELHTGDVSDGSDGRSKSEFEGTPIVVGGTMYLSTPFNRVLAVDPETGNCFVTVGGRSEKSRVSGDDGTGTGGGSGGGAGGTGATGFFSSGFGTSVRALRGT